MKRITLGSLLLGSFVGLALLPVADVPTAEAQKKPGKGIPMEYRKTIEKGLEWLAKDQQPDGHWASDGDNYPVSMTGLAGVALLMEGSTAKTGKYAKNIRKAVDWLVSRSNKGEPRDGLIADTNNQMEKIRYMYGQGFSLLFLASVYGDEEDKARREVLKDVITRGIKYIADAQSSLGGWYYTSRKEGGDNDEGSVTVTQLQALRAAKNAGIAVPKEVIDKALDYLKISTTTQGGGVIYRAVKGGNPPAVGGERPALTAAAIACGFYSGDYKSELVKKWFKYCKDKIGYGAGAATGHDDYTHYYYAQAMYILGDDGWEKLFGATPAEQRLTWSDYRKAMFGYLQSQQSADGSWNPRGGWGVGRVFATSVNLTIMQLDKNTLPIHQK